ncbi:glycosyltransferase family 4 protein [Patescibacteria group bacterium]
MRLLMITRKVDKLDGQTGFVFNWIGKLSKRVKNIKIICLERGDVSGLPNNVKVFSMGKEKGKNRLKEFIRFQIGILKFIFKVDGVFCHQNPIYTIILYPWAKISRKKIVAWYAHKEVNWQVRMMNFMADKIITSSEAGFQIDSPKRIVIGQGIDINQFTPDLKRIKLKKEWIKIISVGRISKIKNYETLIEAADILKKYGLSFKINIVHQSINVKDKDQINYFNKLMKMIREKDLSSYIKFIGEIPNIALVEQYRLSDVAVNLCPDGAPDKAGLEAMACGLPLLVCNKTFVKDFGHYSVQLTFEEKNPEDLAEKFLNLIKCGNFEEIGKYLRKQVEKNHNLDNLLDYIIKCF